MQQATLCFPVEGQEVLLIEKRRGVGAGYYNGPGGKVEAGETPREAAIREVREEVRLDVHDCRKLGELEFVFGEEPFMNVFAYRTESFSGTPTRTPEAIPEWFHVDDVPYDRMWEDDRHWLPSLLDGRTVAGEFRFDADGDELRDFDLETDVEF